MARHKNSNWTLPDEVNYESATLAVLMDIRDELQELNALHRRTIGCYRFQGIPRSLEKIAENTRKRKPKTRKKWKTKRS